MQWEDRELAEGSVNYAGQRIPTNPRLFQADQKGPGVLRKWPPSLPKPLLIAILILLFIRPWGGGGVVTQPGYGSNPGLIRVRQARHSLQAQNLR